MDYILFHRLQDDGEALTMAPHPDEVGDTRWVTQAELAEMMREGNGLRWSPWFRIIVEEFLAGWWDELEAALEVGGKFADGKIHAIGVGEGV
jgi:isopentenyl-diphosphate delta-isomerase